MLSSADVWIPVQQRIILMQCMISLLGQELVKPGLGALWCPTIVPKTSKEDRRAERPVLKCHKFGNTLHLPKTCTITTKVNEFQVIEEVQNVEQKESDQYSAISEDTPAENYPIKNITSFIEVTKVHTHLP
ncbi:hypothetical protein O181_058618 [Austropuccinia psidii MF-1]|uniref:Uncharacterized protein n=1 Tax=Austropuccinia psidii MF-1 TaxID=1389203 RepID=A0A9Q3HVQ1_9BASI|nr:hypothetical protein [Austropuccinia psidii MF-1]